MALVGTIRVTPEELLAKGNELQTIIDSVSRQFDEIQSIFDSTKSYWVGEAGDFIRTQYAEINTEVTEVLKKWSEHPTDLQKMAGIYSNYNKLATSKAEALAGDILK